MSGSRWSPEIPVSSGAYVASSWSQLLTVATAQMAELSEGLRLLNQADPCVEIMMQQTGEQVIICAGELHLEVTSDHDASGCESC